MAGRRLAVVRDGVVQPVAAGEALIAVDSAAWFAWLADPAQRSFSFQTGGGALTVRRERKGNGWYWYAYRTERGKLRKAYMGKTEDVSAARLDAVAAALFAAPAAPPEGSVRIRLFGIPHAERDGVAVELAAKALALVAFLAVHAAPQPRERVLALLWPDSSDAAARKNLRNLLWRVRAALGEIITGEQHLALAPRGWVDVAAFVQAGRALEAAERGSERHNMLRLARTLVRLYGGTLLDGLFFGDAPDLELWLAGEREHVHELHSRSLQLLVAAYRAAARWNDVIRVARAALTHDPLHEPMYRALIEAHARLGDRAAALRQYALLRDTLRRELNVDPLPETERLRDAVLRGTVHETAAAWSAPAPAPKRPTEPFVGRQAELAVLDAAWAAARTGQAQVVLLLGEAGIGKSRLWQAWQAGRADGPAVLATRCLAVTQSLPFAPLVDLVRSPAVLERLRALASPTPPSWLADLARLLPALRDSLPALPAPVSLPPVEEQRHIFDALIHSIGAATDRPLAVFIDDLHWADRATLDWLGYLLHRAGATPLLLVGACRPDAVPPALLDGATHWRRAGILHQVALERLDRDHAAALVAALHGNPAHADDLFARSAGNPFFLIELLRAEPGTVPAALSDLIQQRLARVGETARVVLQAAAVLQPAISFDALVQVGGHADAATLDALDALLAGGLLVEHADQYAFGHPLIAAVVEQSLGGARRVVLHRRAAAALEQQFGDHLAEYAGRLAYHYQEANNSVEAARYAEQAGAHALALAAPVEAAQFYRQAAALLPTPQRWYGLAQARTQTGDFDGSRVAWAEAERGFVAANDQHGAAWACLELARSYLSSSQVEHVVDWVGRGRAHLAQHADPAAQALAAYLLGAELRAVGGSLDAAAAQLHESARHAAEGARSLLPGILLELGNVRAQQGDLADAITYYQQLVAAAHAEQQPIQEILGYNNIAYHALLHEDMALAHEAIALAFALADEYDIQMNNQWLYSTQGEIALAEGNWDAADMWLRRALAESERIGNAAQMAALRASLALAARGRGDLPGAISMLEAARAAIASANAPFVQAQIELWLAETLLQQNQPAAAALVLSVVENRLQHADYPRLLAAAARLRVRMP